jgi:hypothetical protein
MGVTLIRLERCVENYKNIGMSYAYYCRAYCDSKMQGSNNNDVP